MPLIVGLATNEWYIIQSATTGLKVGLFESCTTDEGCQRLHAQHLSVFTVGVCDRSQGAFDSRHTAVIALLIAAVLAATIQAVFSVEVWALRDSRHAVGAAHIFFSLLSFLSGLVAVIVYDTSIENWLFCGTDFCSFIGSAALGCVNYVGYSYAAVCSAVCILLVALLAIVSNIILYWHEEMPKQRVKVDERKNASRYDTIASIAYNKDKNRWDSYYQEEGSPSNASALNSQAERHQGPISARLSSTKTRLNLSEAISTKPEQHGGFEDTRSSSNEPKDAKGSTDDAPKLEQKVEGAIDALISQPNPNPIAPPPLPPTLADGDWVYQASNGYYWSEESALYYEPTSQLFYDPPSNSWYNPQTGEWTANAS